MFCKKQSMYQGRSALTLSAPIHGLHLPRIGGAEMNKSQVSAVLARDPLAVTKAIVLLFSYQTAEERGSSSTVELNGRGFSAAHAKDASYWARWVRGPTPSTPSHIVAEKVRHYLTGDNCRRYRTLSGRFLDRAREVAAVYWRQLAEASKERAKLKPDVTIKGDDMSHMLRQFDRFQVYPGLTQHA